jgi:hypothetical protein
MGDYYRPVKKSATMKKPLSGRYKFNPDTGEVVGDEW